MTDLREDPVVTSLPRRRAAAAWLALLLIAGCSGSPDDLARVGRSAITRDDFLVAARGGGLSYTGPPDSAKAQLLEDLVRRELMVQGAVGAGLHRDTLFLDQRARLEDQALRERLLADMGGTRPPVSDAEVVEFHRWRGEETRIGLIYLYTAPLARAARAELDAGIPFEAVAQRFNPAGVLPPNGDLGYMLPGGLIEPIDGVVRSGAPGSVVGPITTEGQGWFIVRIVDRRRRDQAPLEAERAMLADMLRQRKQRAVTTRSITAMKYEYGVALRTGAGQRLVAVVAPPGSTFETQMQPPELSEADRGGILADYRGGVYTLGDAMVDFNRPDQPRPNLLVLPSVENWLEGMALERAAKVEARRRKYQDEPAFQRMVRERSNNMLLEAYYNAAVVPRATITPADVRARYDARAASFIRLDGVRLLTVVLPDSASAAQLMLHVGHAGTLREAAAMAAPEARVREQQVRFPTDDAPWDRLQPAFVGMAPGEYSGPHRVDAGWMVMQLRSKDQRLQSFEDLPESSLRVLEGEALDLAREARLTALTDSLRRVIPVRLWPDRLRRVVWPAPVASAVRG